MKKHFNNIFKVFFILVATLGMLYLNSQFDAYTSKPMQYYGSMVEPFKTDGVHITATIYDGAASQNYLDQNLISYGYQPVQITVQNNTENIYLLSQQGVNIPSVSSGDVVSSITWRSVPRSIAFKIVSFFFWPFIIPSTIDTLITWKNHAKLKHDYRAKSVKPCKEIIPAYATVHRILFVPKDKFKENFSVKLQDWESKSMHTFSVHAHAIKNS